MKPPASLERYPEAERWFRERLKLSDAQVKALEKRARKQALAGAELLQLRAADKLLKALDVALKEGISAEEVKKRLRGYLKQLPEDGQFETAFRTNLQTAYSAERQRQMMEPHVLALRPYWLYDAIMDGRTSEICKSCNRTLLPASHPWWSTHRPPLHHRCRSTIRNLTAAAAGIYGITPRPTKLEPEGGFGNPLVEDFTPDTAGVHPELLKAFKKRARARVPGA